MKRYFKRTLLVMAVLVPVVAVAWGAAVYASEEYQQRNVSGTVVHHGDFDIDIDSLRRALEPCADSLAPSMVRLCEQIHEGIIERASKGMIVEICNNSLYQMDFSEWQVAGYWRGRSSAYDALADQNPAPSNTLDPSEQHIERAVRALRLPTQVRSDKILTRGECYTVRRAGTFIPYDSLEVVVIGVRLSGAPW